MLCLTRRSVCMGGRNGGAGGLAVVRHCSVAMMVRGGLSLMMGLCCSAACTSGLFYLPAHSEPQCLSAHQDNVSYIK